MMEKEKETRFDEEEKGTGYPLGEWGKAPADPHLRYDEKTHTYYLGEATLPSVTEIIRSIFPATFYEKNGFAATKGEAIHKGILLWLRAELDEDTVDPRLLAYLQSFWNFMKETDFAADVDWCEYPLYHSLHTFAGRPDLVGYLNGSLVLIEIKTGQKAHWHSLQTAGYALLLLSRSLQIDKRFCLYLKADGKYKLERHDKIDDFQVFMSCLNIHKYKLNL